MPENLQTRDLTTRNLSLRLDTIDEEARTVDAVLTTEAPAEVFDWRRFEVITEVLRMDGAEIPAQVPLLESHRRGSSADVLGSVRGIRTEGENMPATLHFVKGDADVDRVWNKVKQRALTDVSAGYRVTKFQDVPAGQKMMVGGKEYDAGKKALRVSTAWTLKEASIVPIGADPAAKLREQAEQPGNQPPNKQEERIMPDEKKVQEAAPGAPEETATERYRMAKAEQEEVKLAALSAPVVDVAAERQAAIDGERKRQTEIRKLGERHGIAPEIVEKAIDDGKCDATRAATIFLEAVRTETPPAVETGAPGVITRQDGQANVEMLTSGLLHRMGCGGMPHMPKYIGEAKRAELQALAERSFEYAALDTRSLIEECVRIDAAHGGGKDPKTGTRPMGPDGMFRAAVSGSTLTNVFTTSVNAQLMKGFEQDGDTTDWVAQRDVNNFQTQEDLSLGKVTQLKKLPRGGTPAHVDISDSLESFKIFRYAEQFSVDDQDSIDDRLGAILRVPMEMGMAAARMRADLVYALVIANPTLTDTGALFNATVETTTGGHANLGTDAFAAASLKAAITAMNLRTQDEANLNIQPIYLVLSPTLLWDARQLLNSAQLVVSGTADVEVGNVNTLFNVGLQIRSDGRLENGVIDPTTETLRSGSSTRWMLAADPNAIPTITLAFLAGTGRVPQLESYRLPQPQYGIGWKIKYDIGAAALGYRGLYMGKV